MNECQPVIEPSDAWFNRPCMQVFCPICRDNNQHHGQVIVFGRKDGREDAATVVTCVGRDIDERALAGNPSSRRDAIRILFDGECGHQWWLDIVQHKGETFLFAEAFPDE